jgi:hypothetical protein
MAIQLSRLGVDETGVRRVFRTFNAASEPFRRESLRHEDGPSGETVDT